MVFEVYHTPGGDPSPSAKYTTPGLPFSAHPPFPLPIKKRTRYRSPHCRNGVGHRSHRKRHQERNRTDYPRAYLPHGCFQNGEACNTTDLSLLSSLRIAHSQRCGRRQHGAGNACYAALSMGASQVAQRTCWCTVAGGGGSGAPRVIEGSRSAACLTGAGEMRDSGKY
jgi:hypothetical protein